VVPVSAVDGHAAANASAAAFFQGRAGCLIATSAPAACNASYSLAARSFASGRWPSGVVRYSSSITGRAITAKSWAFKLSVPFSALH